MALGKQIRKYRERAGWTLERLEMLSGVDMGTISALERRDSKRSEFGPPLAAAFGLTLEQLLDEGVELPLTPPSASEPSTASYPEEPIHPLPLREADPPYVIQRAWPFQFKYEDFILLSAADRARIDAYVSSIIDTRKADAAQTMIQHRAA